MPAQSSTEFGVLLKKNGYEKLLETGQWTDQSERQDYYYGFWNSNTGKFVAPEYKLRLKVKSAKIEAQLSTVTNQTLAGHTEFTVRFATTLSSESRVEGEKIEKLLKNSEDFFQRAQQIRIEGIKEKAVTDIWHEAQAVDEAIRNFVLPELDPLSDYVPDDALIVPAGWNHKERNGMIVNLEGDLILSTFVERKKTWKDDGSESYLYSMEGEPDHHSPSADELDRIDMWIAGFLLSADIRTSEVRDNNPPPYAFIASILNAAQTVAAP